MLFLRLPLVLLCMGFWVIWEFNVIALQCTFQSLGEHLPSENAHIFVGATWFAPIVVHYAVCELDYGAVLLRITACGDGLLAPKVHEVGPDASSFTAPEINILRLVADDHLDELDHFDGGDIEPSCEGPFCRVAVR